ncbi:MAG TPA: hypothetical protein VF666_14305 [Pyrinomonadaceae bacterium]
MLRSFFTSKRRDALLRESLIFLVFVVLTVVMTWPWARDIRDAAPDHGDSYLNAWIMWWDYHQTFRDPLNLFHAPIFYPYRYALAFSEHNYGIALLFFPLFALGLRPLTIQGLAALLGFVLSGYGAFRLARTLTASNGAAWVTGIAYGFAQYRFHQLAHLNYMFAGWIPLMLEASVIFLRRRTWKSGIWFAFAFFMNALSCIHWFVLTLVPMALSATFLITRYRIWRERDMWQRAVVCLGTAMLLLLPFLLPYQRAATLYGFVRKPEDAAFYSARPIHWLTAEGRIRLWRGFGPPADSGEKGLFPGLLPILFTLAAIFVVKRNTPRLATDTAQDADAAATTAATADAAIHNNDDAHTRNAAVEETTDAPTRTPSRTLLVALDLLALTFFVMALLALGYGGFNLKILGFGIMRATDAARPLFYLTVTLIARLCVAYPEVLRVHGDANLVETIRAARRHETFGLGLIWIVTGFCGSLGMNFFFHQTLFALVPIFRSIRVPARWAMIAVLGLALLAGLGAKQLVEALARRQPKLHTATIRAVIYLIICALFLFEQRAAPLELVGGHADPDALTLHLKATPMRGGIFYHPAGGDAPHHRYVLRQADHQRPLVTAISGFSPPGIQELEALSRSNPIPDRYFDLLERLPVSYLVVQNGILKPEHRLATEQMLARGIEDGRLRFIGNFDAATSGGGNADLYVVAKTESETRSDAPPPTQLQPRELGASLEHDPTLLLSEFERWSYPIYRFYKASYGRLPKFAEFMTDARAVGEGVAINRSNWEEQLAQNLRGFADRWTERQAFKAAYAGKSNEQYVERLYANAGITPDDAERSALVNTLNNKTETRAGVLWKVVNNEAFARKDSNAALVLMNYFGYLRRNPDDSPDNNLNGYNFWLKELEQSGDRNRITNAFMDSSEYKAFTVK